MADMNPTAAANTANTVTPQNEAEKKPMFWGSQEVFDNLEKFEKISNPTSNDFNFDFWDLQSPVIAEGQSTQEEQWLQQNEIAAETPVQSSALSDFNFDDVVNSVAEWETSTVENSQEAWTIENQEWDSIPSTEVSFEQPNVEENPTSDIQNMNLEIPWEDKGARTEDTNLETAPIDLNIGDLPASEEKNENNEEEQQSETSAIEESNDFELDIPAQGPSFEEDKEDKPNQTEENIPSFDFDFPWTWTDVVNNEEKNWENIDFAPVDDEKNDGNNEMLDNQEEEEKQADPVLEVSLDDEDTKESAETEENKEEESIEKEIDTQETTDEENEENKENDEDDEEEDESNEDEEDTDEEEDEEDEDENDEDEEVENKDDEQEDDNDEEEDAESDEDEEEDADEDEQEDDNNELENDNKLADEQNDDLWEEVVETEAEEENSEDKQEIDEEEKIQKIEETDDESEENDEEGEENQTKEETIEEQSAEEKAALNMEEYDTENLSSLMKQYRELLNLAKTMIWLEQKINKDETIAQTEIIGNNTEKNMIRYLISIEWEENQSLIIMRVEKDYARDEESEHKLEFTSEEGDKNLIIKVDDFKLYEEILDLQDPVKQLQVWDKMKKFNFLFQWRLSELEEKMEEIKEMKEKMRAFRDIFRNF